MSGDVQPRKRKDRKRKKDELGIEEPRGTAAALGEGDVFMHSQHDHGTGGHWCAKIIFFSLLAVLIGLIGLIILENRGLSELEANAVESRYSGVLEGWLEDAPDENHHDEHTLDLKHHEDDEIDQDENDISNESDQDHNNEDANDETDNENNDSNDEIDGNQRDDDHDHDNGENEDGNYDSDGSQEGNNSDELISDETKTSREDQDSHEYTTENQESAETLDEDNDEDEQGQQINRRYYETIEDNKSAEESDERQNKYEDNEPNNDSFEDIDKSDESVQTNMDHDEGDNRKNMEYTGDNESNENPDTRHEDSDVEIEKIEKEYTDEEISTEIPVTTIKPQIKDNNEKLTDVDFEEDDDDFLSEEDIEEEPIVEHITVPRGKPLPELEDEISSEKLPNTLAEEEEYERQQAELRRDKEQASHMWLKIVVGCALLVATHAVLRRATAPRDTLPSEEHGVREETPSLIDRRMTLIPEESISVIPKVIEEISPSELMSDITEHITSIANTTSVAHQEIEDKKLPLDVKDITPHEIMKDDDEEKELFSDEDDEDVKEEIYEEKIKKPEQNPPDIEAKPEVTHESDIEEVSDVEIIDEEQLEEELIDEEEDEISDVDDSELLTRLEAKYGRLPEPERPGQKYKDGGNHVEDEWPGEPSDAYWRQQLDQSERELRQDWLD